MRKADKKQAEEAAESLRRIHTAIMEHLKRGRRETALALLEQCQNLAIHMGETIEAEMGEGFITVALLEHYCEAVYQKYEEVRTAPFVSARQLHNDLAKELLRIGRSIRDDISVRTEAVFLPYKASMWDSMESIWRAAEEDPDCDAYVIPIPYYDRNPDGSFREIHYEGDLYPKDVPITDYEEYDFAKRRPDMIFIHNPYDGCNYVTSVAPFFYSDNLKRFTEKLIYVPYFILGEIDPDNEGAVENMAHFCRAPGVIHADKVIVQSENMRQAYIKVLTREAGEHSRKYWEEKILGLGSPKVEKVRGTRREDTEIPEEWKVILQNPDGTFKKVVLYNTGISALLRHGEKMLEKMRHVFWVFEGQKEKVALLWRPHPLNQATIGSMRPQLLEKYEKLAALYREEGWGIYDDTPELDRAIALSDAYYGDGSSLVQLCRSVGMPVMIQDVDIL